MTVDKCILTKARQGKLSLQKAKAMAEEYRKQLGEGSPAHRAAMDAVEIVKERFGQDKRRKLLLAQRQVIIGRRIQDADNKVAAGLSFLHFDERGRFGGDNVASQHEVIRGLLHARMSGAIEEFRSKKIGFQKAGADKVKLRSMVREIMGEATNDPEAKAWAAGVNEALEFGRRMFNDAGGNIPKRGMAPIHSREAIQAVTKEEWIAEVFPRIDRTQMIDVETGRAMGQDDVIRTLSDTYDEITSSGLSEVTPTGIKRNVATKRQERNLPFRSADAWLDYQERFGAGNAYEAIMATMDGLARDTALMKVLGPNPDATVQFIKRSALGKDADKGGLVGGKNAASVNALYAQVSGSALEVGSQTVADVMGSVRAWEVATKLGSAFISALTDTVFSQLTARFNGFSGTRVIGSMLKTFGTASKADRVAALRAGFTVDVWTTTLAAQQRFSSDALGHNAARRVADVVLRGSFLSSWTEAGKVAFQREFMFHLTDQAGKTFAKLPGHVRRAFRRHGITEADWNTVRRVRVKESTGLERLDIGKLAENAETRDAAIRVNSMILNESKFAVPEATPKTKALVTQGSQAGTLMGEIMRTTALFKTFPISILQTHVVGRLFGDAQISVRNRLAYGANLVIGTTMMGALSVQVKEMLKGKDPRPMTGTKFWIDAFLQGGSGGIVADILFSDHNKFGNLTDFLIGPVGADLLKLERLTLGNIAEAVEGEDTNIAPELLLFSRAMMPGQNLWYTKLALERAVIDNLMRAADPNFPRRFARIERRARSRTGQGFFSPPGRGIERAPNLENILRPEP